MYTNLSITYSMVRPCHSLLPTIKNITIPSGTRTHPKTVVKPYTKEIDGQMTSLSLRKPVFRSIFAVNQDITDQSAAFF